MFNNRANCVACHTGWNFTDHSFHDIGLAGDDIGRGEQVPGVVVMQHAFKVPTLRNGVDRAPYMHDGSLKNLYSVVKHYNNGFEKRPSKSEEIFALNLTDEEQAELVAFLKTLSSNDTPVALPSLPAYDQTLGGSVSDISPAAGPVSGGRGLPSKGSALSRPCNKLLQHGLRCGN